MRQVTVNGEVYDVPDEVAEELALLERENEYLAGFASLPMVRQYQDMQRRARNLKDPIDLGDPDWVPRAFRFTSADAAREG